MGEIVLQVKPVAGQIQTNFNEIEKQLVIEMSQYDNVVFTEDTEADDRLGGQADQPYQWTD